MTTGRGAMKLSLLVMEMFIYVVFQRKFGRRAWRFSDDWGSDSLNNQENL